MCIYIYIKREREASSPPTSLPLPPCAEVSEPFISRVGGRGLYAQRSLSHPFLVPCQERTI